LGEGLLRRAWLVIFKLRKLNNSTDGVKLLDDENTGTELIPILLVGFGIIKNNLHFTVV